MIDIEKIDINWINLVSKENRNADKILVEKVIRAFLLLEGLCRVEVPFVFKGGTSLMLLLGAKKRMSIDIDIIVERDANDLDEKLNHVAKEQGFVRVELQRRTSLSSVPKRHYKFFYNPIHKTVQEEEYVLLDILFAENPYSLVEEREIVSPFVPIVEPIVFVKVPSPENLLGDKLTAFAPNTTGVPYYKHGDSMSMEIVKQLYDIGCLFDITRDFVAVCEVFDKLVIQEAEFRGRGITEKDVIEDIFQTSLCISTRGVLGRGDFAELLAGIGRVKGFVFSKPYHIEDATVSASKIAYSAALIATGASSVARYTGPDSVSNLTIRNTDYNKLNKLKKSNSEAFYYWYHAVELMSYEDIRIYPK